MSDPSKRNLRTLWLILAVCAAPVVASFTAYYLMPRGDGSSYGELLPTQAAPHLAGTRDGRPWTIEDERGRWVVVLAAPVACDDACAARLLATRQARTMQGRARDRVQRVWLATGDATPAAERLAEHPDVAVVHADARSVARLPRGADAVYLVDPLGNQVLSWPASPDIRGVARDLARLLKASRIG